MIRLTRPDPPVELTASFVRNKTAEYVASGLVVWDYPFIKSALASMSFAKCAYCECSLGEESKYLEVEHFADKKHHAGRVLDWTNLLPACRRCNARKSDHDVAIEPIVDPATEDPRQHLSFRFFRFDGTSVKGTITEQVLDLNEYSRLMLKRFELGSAVLEQVDELLDLIRSYNRSSVGDVRQRNRIQRQLRNLMAQGQANTEYSATVATVLIQSLRYADLAGQLKALSLWSSEFNDLHNGLVAIAYP